MLLKLFNVLKNILLKISGNVVNIPADVSTLPHENSTIKVQLKCKLQYNRLSCHPTFSYFFVTFLVFLFFLKLFDFPTFSYSFCCKILLYSTLIPLYPHNHLGVLAIRYANSKWWHVVILVDSTSWMYFKFFDHKIVR